MNRFIHKGNISYLNEFEQKGKKFLFGEIHQRLHYYVMYIRVLSGHLRGMCAGTLATRGLELAPCLQRDSPTHTWRGRTRGRRVDDRTQRKDKRKNERDSRTALAGLLL